MRFFRVLISIVVLAMCGAGCAKSNPTAGSGVYPADDIRLIITYAAGGPTDIAGRAIATYFEKKHGVAVVVENVDGGSGSVGTAQLSAAPADGYTIAMTTSSAASRVPLIEDVGYTLDDLEPMGVGTVGTGIIYVPAESPYKTAEEFFAAAEANPDTITVGTAGAQSPQHVEFERLKMEYGIEFNLIPFKGEAPSITALVGRNIDASFATSSQIALSQVEAGELRALAVGSAERVDYAPDAPTLKELGYDSLVYGNSMYLLVAPKETPRDVIDMWESTLEEALQDPEVVKAIGKERLPAEFIGAQAITDQMNDEIDVLAPVLKELFG